MVDVSLNISTGIRYEFTCVSGSYRHPRKSTITITTNKEDHEHAIAMFEHEYPNIKWIEYKLI
jgi:hypothetical protein